MLLPTWGLNFFLRDHTLDQSKLSDLTKFGFQLLTHKRNKARLASQGTHFGPVRFCKFKGYYSKFTSLLPVGLAYH